MAVSKRLRYEVLKRDRHCAPFVKVPETWPCPTIRALDGDGDE